MKKETFRVEGLSDALEAHDIPLSPVVRAAGFVFVSGQPPIDRKTGRCDMADVVTQTEIVLDNVKTCLETAGSSLEKVVKCTVFISNAAYYKAVNDVYARYFPHDPPARTFVAVGSWPLEFDVEIECIALA